MADLSDKVRKARSGHDNPQLTRINMLKKKKSDPMKATRNLKRKSTARKKSMRIDRENTSFQREPMQASLSITEKAYNRKYRSAESESELREVTPPDLSNTGAEKSLIWNDHREDELEARLKKLHKILGRIKEERLYRLKDRVMKWQEKYAKRLLDLELSMHNFETRCKCDKSEISEQISRVEDMSDTNKAIRQRIEKKLGNLAPGFELEENNRYFTTVTVNFVKKVLYYIAQIRDAFWQRTNRNKFNAVDVASSNSKTDHTDSSEKKVSA